MADRVGLIRDGRLIMVEHVSALQRRAAHLVDVTVRDESDAAVFASMPNVSHLTTSGRSIHFEFTGDVNPLVRALAARGLEDLSIREPSLEELFMSFYGDADG